MSLLEIMEFVLGSIDKWPTAILKRLFVAEPTPSNIKTLAAFFCGSGIPFCMANYFFNLCNDWGSDQATNIMRTYFVLWHCLKFRLHFGVYYNTTFRKLMWLNGGARNQMEDIAGQVPDVGLPLGIDRTGFSLFIRMKLFVIRAIVLEFPYWDVCYYKSR